MDGCVQDFNDLDMLIPLLEEGQFTCLPFGPLSRYISDDIDEILDVGHLADTMLVNSLNDVPPLKQTARSFNISIDHIIQYKFNLPLIEVAKEIPGYENILIPVMNVFLDYGKQKLVGAASTDFYHHNDFDFDNNFDQESSTTPITTYPQVSELDKEQSKTLIAENTEGHKMDMQPSTTSITKHPAELMDTVDTDMSLESSNIMQLAHRNNTSSPEIKQGGEFEKAEVILNILLHSPQDFELDVKPIAKREDFMCTLDCRKIPLDAARADDNGAFAKRGNSTKFYLLEDGKTQTAFMNGNGSFFINVRVGVKDGKPLYEKKDVANLKGKIYQITRHYRYSKGNDFKNMIVTIRNAMSENMHPYYMYLNKWTGDSKDHKDFVVERHGNATKPHTGPYFKKDKTVFQEARQRLKNGESPDQIYVDMSVVNEKRNSMSSLVHTPKLLHNQKSLMSATSARMEKIHEVDMLVGLLNDDTFVQSLSFNSTCYSSVNYTTTMLNDLWRFCVKGNSPWVVDTTFNVADNLWLTDSSYINESLLDENGKHPAFPGPSQWQFRRDTNSFRRFGGELVIADPRLLDIKKVGHDLDKATSKGIGEIFINAKRLWCTQHMQNADSEKLRKLGANQSTVSKIMADVYGCQVGPLESAGLADAEDADDYSVKLLSLRDVWEDLVPGYHSWFSENRSSYFKECLVLSAREDLGIAGRFYSNDLELKHRLLKKKLRENNSSDDVKCVSEHITKWVKENYFEESIKAIAGYGKYRLAKGYEQFYVEPVTWTRWSSDRRTQHINTFHNFVPRSIEKYSKPVEAGQKTKPKEKRRSTLPEPEMFSSPLESISTCENSNSPTSVSPIKLARNKENNWQLRNQSDISMIPDSIDVFNPFRDFSKFYTLVHRNDKREFPTAVKRCEECKVAFTSYDIIAVKTTATREFTNKSTGKRQKTVGNVYLHYLKKCLHGHDQKFQFTSVLVPDSTKSLLSDCQKDKLRSQGCQFS